MHSLVQDRHDTDVAVAEPAPIDDVPLIPEEEPADAELRRDRMGNYIMRGDLPEGIEQSGDGVVRLLAAPAVPRMAIDLIEAMGCRLLNADGGHPGSNPVARDDLVSRHGPVVTLRGGKGKANSAH